MKQSKEGDNYWLLLSCDSSIFLNHSVIGLFRFCDDSTHKPLVRNSYYQTAT